MSTMQATMPLLRSVPMPMPTGSLEAYIQTVNRIPLLTAPEERELALRFRDHNDLEAARRLVLSHLRLVSFAIHWVKAEIHEYILRNWRLVKLATTKAQRKLFFNLRSMKSGLAPMTAKDVERIAGELRVKPEEVLEMETRLSGQEIAFEADQDDEDGYAPANYLAADRDAEPLSQLEAKESEEGRAAGLEDALHSLDPRSRRIIEARWLREKDAATLHDLAAEFKVSAERIRQIEAKALGKMKKVMQAPARARLALPSPAA